MARTQQSTPQLRALYALSQARQYRHHRHCHCGEYEGSGCNDMDAMWTRRMDKELESL